MFYSCVLLHYKLHILIFFPGTDLSVHLLRCRRSALSMDRKGDSEFVIIDNLCTYPNAR